MIDLLIMVIFHGFLYVYQMVKKAKENRRWVWPEMRFLWGALLDCTQQEMGTNRNSWFSCVLIQQKFFVRPKLKICHWTSKSHGLRQKEVEFNRQSQPVPSKRDRQTYPLVNIQKTMENHHFLWVNPL